MSLVAFVVVVLEVVALAGSRFRPNRLFEALRKPPFNPPMPCFAPVWTILAVRDRDLGMAGIDRRRGLAWTPALTLWAIQLALNGIWSWLFFRVTASVSPWPPSFVLLAVIVACGVTVAPQSALAAWLFVPYALWVAFATLLNASSTRSTGRSPRARRSRVYARRKR